MWVFFGFISLTLFTLVSLGVRLKASWRGKPHEWNGRAFELRERKHKGRLVGFDIGVRGAGRLRFALQPEDGSSRLAKRIGLSVEHQTGDALFDERLYVVSDDPVVCRTLSESSGLRERVLKLVSPGIPVRFSELQCAAGRLWVRYDARAAFKPHEVTEAGRAVSAHLARIAEELSRVEVRFADRLRDPFILRAALVLACSTALGLYGLFAVIRMVMESSPPAMVHPFGVFGSSAPFSFLVLAALVGIGVVLLGRTSRAHLVLLEVLLVGGFGAFTSGYLLYRDTNRALDERPGTALELRVHDREVRGGKYKSYHLVLEDFAEGKPSRSHRRSVSVSHALWSSAPPGSSVRLTLREGGLGHRWVESIQALPGSRRPQPPLP